MKENLHEEKEFLATMSRARWENVLQRLGGESNRWQSGMKLFPSARWENLFLRKQFGALMKSDKKRRELLISVTVVTVLWLPRSLGSQNKEIESVHLKTKPFRARFIKVSGFNFRNPALTRWLLKNSTDKLTANLTLKTSSIVNNKRIYLGRILFSIPKWSTDKSVSCF